MSQDVLPDSRARGRRGAIRYPGGMLIPIYCANCGKEWGLVPEEHITFAFVLCEPCAEKMGPIAHTYKEPDAVFWERVADAQQKTRIDTPEALARELEDPSSVFSKLAHEWRRHASK